MTALNFPTSPTLNQTYTAAGRTWQWNGAVWVTVAASLDADLTAIAALTGTSGLLRKTATDTWALDTNSYLTGNQSITVSGDASGSGATSIALTLANSGVTAGTYPKVTVDAKGRVIAGSTLATADLPTTLQTGSYAPGLLGSVSATVTAAGTTQSTATALTSDINIVTSATAGSATGVVAPGATTGKYLIVVNRTATAINVYPASGHAFDGQAANTPISLPAGGFLEYFGSSTNQWHSSYQALTQGAYVVGAVTAANAWTTARTETLSGDVNGSASIDGSANWTITTTLANSGVTAGTYGSSSAVPVVTVDAKGRVTGVTTTSLAGGGQYFGTAATKAIAYNSNAISENVTVTAGNNGLTAGPVTVGTGYAVTVESGAIWTVV